MKISKTLFLLILLLCGMATAVVVFAEAPSTDTTSVPTSPSSSAPTTDSKTTTTPPTPKPVEKLFNPLSGTTDENASESCGNPKDDAIGYFACRLGSLVSTMLILLASLSVIPIVLGGIQLISSQGSTDKVEKGRKTLFWGVAGLVLGLLSIAIWDFILGLIVG